MTKDQAREQLKRLQESLLAMRRVETPGGKHYFLCTNYIHAISVMLQEEQKDQMAAAR